MWTEHCRSFTYSRDFFLSPALPALGNVIITSPEQNTSVYFLLSSLTTRNGFACLSFPFSRILIFILNLFWPNEIWCMPDRLRVVYLVLELFFPPLLWTEAFSLRSLTLLLCCWLMKAFLFWMVWCWISSHLSILFLYLLSLHTLLYCCSKILKTQNWVSEKEMG